MNIEFNGNYKSLSSFKCSDLQGLSIITGKNGSGKTQFLDLFRQLKSTAIINDFELIISPKMEINDIMIEGITTEMGIGSRTSWRNSIDFLKDQLTPHRMLLDLIDKAHEESQSVYDLTIDVITSFYKDQTDEIISSIYAKLCSPVGYITVPIYENDSALNWSIILKAIKKLDKSIALYENVANFRKKRIKDLKPEDFEKASIDERLISRADLFYSSLDEIIFNYAKRRFDNLYQLFLKKELNQDNESISHAEFIEKNPSPEKIINEIFDKHNIGYNIFGIDSDSFSYESSYRTGFKKKGSNSFITSDDLSSGEKIIIGLIVKLFFIHYFDSNLSFPKVLLLDEPDAYLHPEMSKLLIDILQKWFVERFGITVIMTTHSASTVALAPENSIWILNNIPETTLQKTTKDEALTLLTQNIPTLSIDYQNHRQVFVESPTDVEYYQTIHDKCCHRLNLQHKLYFISNASGKGNCDQVIRIVNAIRKAGNRTCLGIIDWDKKERAQNDFVFVHGRNSRYSIENFILDPIYVAIFFLRGNQNNIVGELNFESKYNEYSLVEEDNTRLQNVADWIISKIEEEYPAYTAQKQRREMRYSNDKTIQLPIWFIDHNGHDLLDKYKGAFKSLNSIDGRTLYNNLLTIIGKCSSFAPIESVDLLKIIAN